MWMGGGLAPVLRRFHHRPCNAIFAHFVGARVVMRMGREPCGRPSLTSTIVPTTQFPPLALYLYATLRMDRDEGRAQGSPPHIHTTRVPTTWARATPIRVPIHGRGPRHYCLLAKVL